MAQILPNDPFMIRMKSLTSPSKWGLWIGLEINYFAPQNMSKKVQSLNPNFIFRRLVFHSHFA